MAWREDLYNPYRDLGRPLTGGGAGTSLANWRDPTRFGTSFIRDDTENPPGGNNGTNPPPTNPPPANTTPPPNRNDPSTSRNAPRLVQEGDQWVLTEHGNRRVLQPSEVEGARAYVEDFWRQFPTGFQPGQGPQTNAGYDPTPPPPGPTNTRRVGLTGREQFDPTAGFDANNFNDLTNQNLKYRAGRILMRYPATSNGVRQAMQDPEWLADADLSQATFNGRDRISFHGALSDGETGVPVNDVDVLRANEEDGSSAGYWWGDQDAMGYGSGTPTPPTTPTPTTPTPTTPTPPGTTNRPPATNPGDGAIFPGDTGNRPMGNLSGMMNPANVFGAQGASVVGSNAIQPPGINEEAYRKLAAPGLPLTEYARLGRWRTP